MDVLVIIITALICLAVNFALVILAILIAVKIYVKGFITILDECEEADKQQIFMRFWKKHESE